MDVRDRFHLLVPAAGTGTRAGTVVPKQYQVLAGQALILHTLLALSRVPDMASLNVVIREDDDQLRPLLAGVDALCAVRVFGVGGATRAASVAAGLRSLREHGAHEHDWVLVHDAARCLIEPAWVIELIEQCRSDPVGGLLALPLPDTLKQADAQGRVSATLPRGDKWLAQTPQMFRHGLLLDALRKAGVDDVTDESSAVERLGHRPRLVMGSPRNLKVTRPEDALLAELILKL